MKMYICRGTGTYNDLVVLSEALLELENCSYISWDNKTIAGEYPVVQTGTRAKASELCYEGWLKATGIKIAPGEVTAVEFKEVPA